MKMILVLVSVVALLNGSCKRYVYCDCLINVHHSATDLSIQLGDSIPPDGSYRDSRSAGEAKKRDAQKACDNINGETYEFEIIYKTTETNSDCVVSLDE